MTASLYVVPPVPVQPEALTPGQAEVLGLALADAIEHRRDAAEGSCADCEAHPGGKCSQHAADLDRADDYQRLADELGIEVDL